MNNINIINAFATGIELAIASLFGITLPYPLRVIASKQDTTQGPETGVIGVYFHEVNTKRYGWPQKYEQWNPVLQLFEQVQSQQCETIYQINVTYLVDDRMGYQTSDWARMVADAMASDKFLRHMRVNNVAILRITDVRNPSFKNDQEEWEPSPSFDATITYRDERRFTVPAVTATDAEIHRV